MLQPNEPPDTPDWTLPERGFTYPADWRGPEDDPGNIIRGVE